MENRELTVDDLSSPVDESMENELQPAMSYFAEGGEVEQGLFSQQIPQRPTVQVPQQRLKRTAAEMLQRMPQVPLGTMRFSPLSMPGILGRQIPRFAEGGEVDAEQRALMARQMDLGAPTENLFGANLSMPSLPPAVSFETNIPSFTPTYAPPTGPVTTPGTAGALGQYPGIGGGADLEYQQTLYEQLSPTTLAAPATTFTTATEYTPTAQTTTRPTVLSREEAMLKQPTLVRYEPDASFGGLTTYKGPLQSSPTTGGTDTDSTETGGGVKTQVPFDQYQLYGFSKGQGTGPGRWWFNEAYGHLFVPSGYTPLQGSGWTAWSAQEEEGGEDTVEGAGQDTLNWGDTNFFLTGNYRSPLDAPEVGGIQEAFETFGGVSLPEEQLTNFKQEAFGWVADPNSIEGGSFNLTPAALNNIRSTDAFKSGTRDTLKKLYEEMGYVVGGDTTTANRLSETDLARLTNAVSLGQTDVFRIANTLTSPARLAGRFQLTSDKPVLTSLYLDRGLTLPGHLNKNQINAVFKTELGRNVDRGALLYYASNPQTKGLTTEQLGNLLRNSREAQVQAAYQQAFGRRADPAGLKYYTSGEGRNVDLGVSLSTSREAQVRKAYQDVLKRNPDIGGLQFYTSGEGRNVPIENLRTMFGGGERPPAARFRGSPPEGEYADPVAALRERMRMRREAGTMDQGTARDRLKKFLGGEDLAPVRMAEGGDVSRESQVRKVYQDVLGRAADEAGLQYYTTGEGKRYAAAQLADMFGASREGQIQKLYQNVLGRSTDPGGMDYYLRGEGRALTPDQIAEGFRGSEEYKSKQRTTAPAAVTTTKGPRPLTREGLLQEAMLFGGNSYNALGAYGPNSLNRRGYLTEKGRQQMINEIQPKAVADLIMRGQSVGLSPDEIQQAVQSGWQRGAESNRDFVVAEREAQANFVPEWFKIASALAGAHMMGTQILNQGASSLAPAASGASVSSASVPVFGTPYTGMELGKIGAAAVQGYQNPNRASAANIVNTVFPSPFGALPRIEDIELFNQGGLVQSFGKGGAVKSAAEALKDVVVSIPSKLAEVEKYVLKREGKVGAERLQKAADEIKNLEDQYTTEALQRAFTGDNAKLLMIGDPSKFQDFATRLQDPYRPAVERYWREMSARGGGAPQVPFLVVRKDEGLLPFIAGHEGRHRNIAANDLGYSSTLWQLLGEGGMREPLPRGSREEFLAALKEIAGDKPLVIPQDRWAVGKEGKLVRDWKKARNLPEPFKHGGLVHRQSGSPEYGEIAIGEGGFTKDTLRGLRSGRGGDTFLSDSAKMLRNVFGEGVSNLESVVRGSVAAIPGSAGDIESIFRDDKNRKLATTEEILRDRMPKRMTKPTKEAGGFEEVGTYLPLPVPAGTVTKTAGMVKTGARKALEELGPVAGTMLERTVPKFGILPEGPAAPKNLSERIDQGKFFKGRLDDFVSQLRNPVTKQQFLGSLKGKFREYEISRAAQALADLDDAAKLTPTDLASRISTVASPARYKTTFIEPRDSGLHNRFDNVYGATGQPVGVINLSYEPTRAAVEAEEASDAARSAAAGLGRSTGDPEKIQTITSFLETSQELAKDPERKAQLLTGLKNLSNQLSTARAEITPVTQGLTDIVFANIPEFKGYSDKLSEAVKNISFPRNTPEYEEAFKNISKEVVNKIKVQALQRLYQEQPSLRTFLPLKEGETFEDLVRNLGGTNYVAEEMLPLMRKNLLERSDDTAKAILVDNMALLDDVLKETQRYSTYKGTHAAVNPEKNAMGFSRFTEHQVNVPGFGKLDGIYVSELQSDMFRDIKKLGKKGGSAAKDKQEITSLFDGIKAKLGPLKTQIEDRFGSMDSFLFVVRGDLTGTPKPAEFSNFLTELGPISKSKADQMAADLVGDLKRITKLQERLGLPGGQVKGTYSIEEPIANIERQPQVVQQMLIKNAVAGAMKMGKNFVAFPGVESSKAQLYEKLPNNLKAVLKDLGEGFVIEPVVIKDKTGVERTHRALIWDNNAAQRVLNNGVSFKKGGLVEKSAVDNRRYI